MSSYSDLILSDNPIAYYRLGDSGFNLNGGTLGNPSFEIQANGTANGWIGGSVGTGTVTAADTHARTGNYNGLLTNPSTGNYGALWGGVGIEAETPTGVTAINGTISGIPINGANQLQISAWFKGNANGSTGPFRVVVSNGASYTSQPSGDGSTTSIDNTIVYTGSPNYQYFSFTVQVPAGYLYAYIEMYAAGNGTMSSVYIDDVTLIWIPIVQDPSFEAGTLTQVRKYWDTSGSSEFSIDSSEFVSGVSSIKNTNTRTTATWSSIQVLSPISAGGNNDLFPVLPGQQYQISFWWKQARGGRQTHQKVQWFKSDGTFISSVFTLGGTDQYNPWTYITQVVTAPALAAYMNIALMNGWWDGMSFGESWENGLNSWVPYHDTINVISGNSLYGSNSLVCVNNDTTGSWGSAKTGFPLPNGGGVGTTVTASFWFKSQYRARAYLSFAGAFDVAGSWTTGSATRWTQAILTTTIPSGTTSIVAYLMFENSDLLGNGKIGYADGYQLEVNTVPTPFYDGANAQIWWDDVTFWPATQAFNQINAAPNGLLVGGVSTGQTGAINDGDKAMLFDGSTGYVRLASTAVPVPVTLEAWIKTTDAGTRTIWSNRPGNTSGLWFGISGGKMLIYSNGGPTGTKTINDGNWHHVVGIASGGHMTIYVDGVLDVTSTQALVPVTSTAFIGHDAPNTPGFEWNGTQDELAIYNSALTSAQIMNHYNAASVAWLPSVGGQIGESTRLTTLPANFDVATTEIRPYTVNVAGYLGINDGISAVSAVLLNISTGQQVTTGWQGSILISKNTITIPIVGSALALGQKYQLAVTFTSNFQRVFTYYTFVNVVA